MYDDVLRYLVSKKLEQDSNMCLYKGWKDGGGGERNICFINSRINCKCQQIACLPLCQFCCLLAWSLVIRDVATLWGNLQSVAMPWFPPHRVFRSLLVQWLCCLMVWLRISSIEGVHLHHVAMLSFYHCFYASCDTCNIDICLYLLAFQTWWFINGRMRKLYRYRQKAHSLCNLYGAPPCAQQHAYAFSGMAVA